jgi:DNA replication protein DnaC
MITKNTTNGREWSASDIYLRPSPCSPMPPRMVPMSAQVASRRFTEGFVEAYLAETRWDLIDDLVHLTPGDIASIVNDGAPCPVCAEGRDWLRYRGLSSGIVVRMQVDHGCRPYVQVGVMWRKVMPEERYRHIRLDALEPNSISLLPLKKQQEYIKTLKENSADSFLFGGKSGAGKTHLSIALLFEAVERWYLAWEEDARLSDQSVFWIEQTSELLDQIQNQKQPVPRDDVDPPMVTVQEIKRLRKLGQKVTLVMDEFSQFNPTDVRLANLAQLISTVYTGGGQIVALTNVIMSELEKKWAGFASGDTITRRIYGPEANGSYLRFSGLDK